MHVIVCLFAPGLHAYRLEQWIRLLDLLIYYHVVCTVGQLRVAAPALGNGTFVVSQMGRRTYYPWFP